MKITKSFVQMLKNKTDKVINSKTTFFLNYVLKTKKSRTLYSFERSLRIGNRTFVKNRLSLFIFSLFFMHSYFPHFLDQIKEIGKLTFSKMI